MLSSVEDSPVYLPRIPFGKECQLAFCIKKWENLSVSPGVAPPVSRVDLVTETVELDLHGCGCRSAGKMVKSTKLGFEDEVKSSSGSGGFQHPTDHFTLNGP